MSAAVSYANFGKLRFKTTEDQGLWHECSRLITNCIIFYNSSILSVASYRGCGHIKKVLGIWWVPH